GVLRSPAEPGAGEELPASRRDVQVVAAVPSPPRAGVRGVETSPRGRDREQPAHPAEHQRRRNESGGQPARRSNPAAGCAGAEPHVGANPTRSLPPRPRPGAAGVSSPGYGLSGAALERPAPALISVVIPMFNEQDSVPALLGRIEAALRPLGIP